MRKEIGLSKVLLKKISKAHKIIAKERDKLREIHDDLGDVLDTIDSAQESFARGVSEIESGLDEISQYL